jgi:hypothetical protein
MLFMCNLLWLRVRLLSECIVRGCAKRNVTARLFIHELDMFSATYRNRGASRAVNYI